MHPEVSLSRRWTIPGLSEPPISASFPLQWCSSAFTRVPVRLPAAGWTTIPDVLFSTMSSSSSNRMSMGMFSGWAFSVVGSGMFMVMMSPSIAGVFGLAGDPFTRM